MHCVRWTLHLSYFIAIVATLGSSSTAQASNNYLFALDGNFVWNRGDDPLQAAGWAGFGRVSYPTGVVQPGSQTLGMGPYDSFRIREDGLGGSGTAINFYGFSPIPGNRAGNGVYTPGDVDISGAKSPVTAGDLAMLDKGIFGTSFDNNAEYTIELKYKPYGLDANGNGTTQNQAQTMQVIIDKSDGFGPDGIRKGHQVGYLFPRLIDYYALAKANGQLDSQGFATIRNNAGAFDEELGWVPGTLDNAVFHGVSQMNGTSNVSLPVFDPYPALDPDAAVGPHGTDYGAFNMDGPLHTPKGGVQFVLQTVNFGQTAPDNPVDDWEIKSVVVKKINPNPNEIVRMDARTGFSYRFGSAFLINENFETPINGYYPFHTDQVRRFDQNGFLPAMVLDTNDSNEVSGLAVWQPADNNVFDGNEAIVEIRARLTQPLGGGQAQNITLVAKDRDGNDLSPGTGGDEYVFNFNLGTAPSTVSGVNGLSTSEFRTFQVPLSSFTPQQAFEFAYAGDGSLSNFNLYYMGLHIPQNAGLVDMELEYLRIIMPDDGQPGDFDGDGDVDGRDFLIWQRGGTNPPLDPTLLADWQTHYSVGTLPGAMNAVPEPGCLLLGAMGMVALGTIRRRVA